MVQAVFFGIFGLIPCFLLEKISIYIIKKKCRDREIDIDMGKLDMKQKAFVFIVNTGLWFFTGLQAGSLYLAVLTSILFSLAMLISIVDLKIHIIPNEFVLVMLIIGVLLQIYYLDIRYFMGAIGCMAGTAAMFLIVGKIMGLHKIGAGDIKLAGVMGFALGYPGILTALMVMGATMLIYCFIGFSRYKISMKSALPLAPFLMIGMSAGLLGSIVV